MIGACCGSPNESFFGTDDDDEYDDDLTKYDSAVARTGDESCSLEGGIISTTSDSSSGSSSGGGRGGGDDDDTASNSCRKDADVVTTSNRESPDILQTTYSRKTPLFRAIEKQEWESILTFLKTGKWSQYHGLFLPPHDAAASASNNNTASSALIQCKTWVRDGSLNQLPLHLAICKGAPAIVVQHLLDQYPEAVKCCDSENILPLHLAFANEASDAVLYALLRAWPQSFRISPAPYECAGRNIGGHGSGGGGSNSRTAAGANKSSTTMTSSSSFRNEIIRIAVHETQAAVRQKHQDAWKAVIANSGIVADDQLDTTDLPTLLSQLLADRKQLQEMKTMLKGQFSSSSSVQHQQRKGASNSSVSNMTTTAVTAPTTTTTTITTTPPPAYARSGSLPVVDADDTTPDSNSPDTTVTTRESKTKKSSRSWGRRFGFGGKSSSP